MECSDVFVLFSVLLPCCMHSFAHWINKNMLATVPTQSCEILCQLREQHWPPNSVLEDAKVSSLWWDEQSERDASSWLAALQELMVLELKQSGTPCDVTSFLICLWNSWLA